MGGLETSTFPSTESSIWPVPRCPEVLGQLSVGLCLYWIADGRAFAAASSSLQCPAVGGHLHFGMVLCEIKFVQTENQQSSQRAGQEPFFPLLHLGMVVGCFLFLNCRVFLEVDQYSKPETAPCSGIALSTTLLCALRSSSRVLAGTYQG